MKLTLTFTDTGDIEALQSDQLYPVHFDLPDEALHLADHRERVLAIAHCVAQLTDAALHITCKELALKHFQ